MSTLLEQNGHAEEQTSTRRRDKSFPFSSQCSSLSFWWDYFHIVVYLINKLSTPTLNSKSFMQVLFKTTLQYRHLRTFRCAWFPNIHEYDKSLAVTRKNVYSLVIAISIKGKGALVPLEKLTFLATLPLMNMTSRIYPSFLHTNIHLLSLISHILSTLLLWCHLILL